MRASPEHRAADRKQRRAHDAISTQPRPILWSNGNRQVNVLFGEVNRRDKCLKIKIYAREGCLKLLQPWKNPSRNKCRGGPEDEARAQLPLPEIGRRNSNMIKGVPQLCQIGMAFCGERYASMIAAK